MSVFKCKMCGGDLIPLEGQTVCECEYCGSRQTVPTLDSEKKATLFSRANRLRIVGEFDKAYSVYESIVADFPREAEAYWGLVLCKYGIEYVDDPRTGRKIPTCHRSSFDCVLDDEDYAQTLAKADIVSRLVYQAEAEEIERIRADIVELSTHEEPYDIFICYKETDENGDRTVDSLIAQDVWSVLTERGYRVFFSRISLEDKLGQEYEPYIFAALNSARIMLAFGTNYDNYHSVWVKNEWSRYLALIAKGAKKTLIPCYKDIDPYDLPREFRRLQAQDMGKVGAIQDLLRGIRKILGDNKTKAEVIVAPQGQQGIVAPLLKRAFHFLGEEDWQKANEYFEKALDFDYESGEAYLGKLMAELKVCKREQLKEQPVLFDDRESYKNAVRYGEEALKQELAAYLSVIRDRIEAERKEAIYQQALGLMAEERPEEAKELFGQITTYKDSLEKIDLCEQLAEVARKEQAYQRALALMGWAEYAEATQIFAGLSGYKDADIQASECREQAEIARKNAVYSSAVAASKIKTVAKQEEAIALFQSIPGWKDADERLNQCEQRASLLRTKKPRRAEEETHKATKKGVWVWALAIIVSISAIVIGSLVARKHMRYNQAMALIDNGYYAEAVSALEPLIGYRDSEQAFIYAKGAVLLEQGKYTEAAAIFDSLGEYADSAKKKTDCLDWVREQELASFMEEYESFVDMANKKTYTTAIERYEALETCLSSCMVLNSNDVEGELLEAKYLYGLCLTYSKEYEAASLVFAELGDYKDSVEQQSINYGKTSQGNYEAAMFLAAQGEYKKAAEKFLTINSYLDSNHQAQLCFILDGKENRDVSSFLKVQVDLLTPTELQEYYKTCYLVAETALEAQDYETAFGLYQASQIGDFRDKMDECNRLYIASPHSFMTIDGEFIRDIQIQKVGGNVHFIVRLKKTKGEFAEQNEIAVVLQAFENATKLRAIWSTTLRKNDVGTTIEFDIPYSRLINQYAFLLDFEIDQGEYAAGYDPVHFSSRDCVFKDLYGEEY